MAPRSEPAGATEAALFTSPLVRLATVAPMARSDQPRAPATPAAPVAPNACSSWRRVKRYCGTSGGIGAPPYGILRHLSVLPMDPGACAVWRSREPTVNVQPTRLVDGP